MAKIKNIKVSHPTEYTDKLWDELYSKRDKLLRFSDFAVLDDSGLTEDCVDEWRRWRKSLRLLTREKFKTVGEATNMLRKIHSLMPEKEFMTTNDEDTTMIELIKLQEIVNENSKRLEKSEKVENELRKDISKLASIIKKMRNENITKLPIESEALQAYLLDLSCQWYNKQFESALEAPMPVIMERCEQAIDYKVSNDLNSTPLIKNYMKISNMTADEVSDKFISDKTKLMDSISSLDKKIWNIRLQIKHTSEISKLNEIAKELSID